MYTSLWIALVFVFHIEIRYDIFYCSIRCNTQFARTFMWDIFGSAYFPTWNFNAFIIINWNIFIF